MSYALVAYRTGKDRICFYCAPFHDALPEVHTLKKPTTMPTKLAEESELVLALCAELSYLFHNF